MYLSAGTTNEAESSGGDVSLAGGDGLNTDRGSGGEVRLRAGSGTEGPGATP